MKGWCRVKGRMKGTNLDGRHYLCATRSTNTSTMCSRRTMASPTLHSTPILDIRDLAALSHPLVRSNSVHDIADGDLAHNRVHFSSEAEARWHQNNTAASSSILKCTATTEKIWRCGRRFVGKRSSSLSCKSALSLKFDEEATPTRRTRPTTRYKP